MTKTDHLARAKDYIAKGEDYYRKAGQELGALKAEGWTWAALGREVGKSPGWVSEIVAWATKPQDTETPWAGPRGEAREASTAAKVAREQPAAIAAAIAQAPPAAQRKIADAIAASPTAEPSLTHAVKPPERQRQPQSAEKKLGDAVFALWEVGELLMDEAPADAELVRMTALAEKAQRLSAGILHSLGTGKFEDEFRALVQEVGADA